MTSLALHLPASPRGIYRSREHNAWYALDSEGHLVAPGVRVVLADESDAGVVAELAAALDVADPRRKLALVREPITRPAVAALSPATFVRLVRADPAPLRARSPRR